MTWSRNSLVQKIIDSPEACAIVDRIFPGMMESPYVPMFAYSTLDMVQQVTGGSITSEKMDELIATLQAELGE